MSFLNTLRAGGLGWKAAIACGILGINVAVPAMAASTPSFSSATSSLSGIHNADGLGGFDFGSSMPKIVGPAILLSPFAGAGNVLTGTVGANTWTTKARAGAAHVEASNSARITFPGGMGIDQTDPGHVQTASTFQLDFDFRWTATGSMSPIGGAFSIPVGASVPVGGSASFVAHIHWDVTVGGTTYPDARAKYFTPVTSFPVGVTATSFTAPAAPFTPGTLNTGDVLRIYGFLLFSADNNSAPARIEVLPAEQPPDQASDPLFFNLWNAHPELHYEAFSTFDDNEANTVPEPSGIVGLLVASVGTLKRRRRA